MPSFAERYTVIYDACVLYPFTLRDFLMWLALEDIFRAKWTDAIHDEWIRAVRRDKPHIAADRLERTRRLMNQHVLDCLVVDYESLIPLVELPDPDDRHVVAAAIKAQADAIITLNLKHFPTAALAKFEIEPIHPDDFVRGQFDVSRDAVLRAAKQQRENLRNPPMSVDQYLDALIKCELVQTATILRSYREFI